MTKSAQITFDSSEPPYMEEHVQPEPTGTSPEMETTAEERKSASLFLARELTKADPDWPDFAVAMLSIMRVLALLRDFDRLLASCDAAMKAERERNASLWPCAPNDVQDETWLDGFTAGLKAFRAAIRARGGAKP